jgi:hypothetical protein
MICPSNPKAAWLESIFFSVLVDVGGQDYMSS